MFEQLLKNGGVVNALEQSVLVMEKEYYKKNKAFPFVLIPER